MAYNETHQIEKGITMNSFTNNLRKQLQQKPGEAYVTNTYVAFLLDDGWTVLVIAGDFEGATPEIVNHRIMEAINKMM